MITHASTIGSKPDPRSLDSSPRTALLRWFSAVYLLSLGMAFLILPRGPIRPLHGLVWLRGPEFVLCGLAMLWLVVLPLRRRTALVAHGVVAVPLLAVAADYFHLANYGPAVTLLLLGLGLALSPLAPSRPVSRGIRPDSLGLVLGLALAGQGVTLLAELESPTIPYGLQLEIGALFTAFGFGAAACQLIPRIPNAVRGAVQVLAGAAVLALYAILAIGYGPILWLLGVSSLIVAVAFFVLPWLSQRVVSFGRDTVRSRLGAGLFTCALVPLLIAVALALDDGDGATAAARQTAFGTVIGLSILAAMAGWYLARALVDPLSRLVYGVDGIALGVRPVTLVACGPKEVEELAQAVQVMAARLDEQMETVKEARDQHKYVADRLQQALQVPLRSFPGLEVGLVYRSATGLAQLGGDFYDVFRTPDGRVGVMIGDVSGRGLDAAAQAVLTRSSLRAFTYTAAGPAAALACANRLLLDTDSKGFVTALFGILDPVGGGFLYSLAGHPPPVLLTGGKAAMPRARSPVLGVFGTSVYEDVDIRLSPADTLVLYTDGLTEARRDQILFGDERLLAEVEARGDETPSALARGLFQAAADHAGGELLDDVAVLVLRLRPPAEVWRPALKG